MRPAAMSFARLLSFAACIALSHAAASWKPVNITGPSYTTRSDCSFGRCGDKLCLLGGRDQGTPQPANIFDTEKLEWSEAPGAPEGIHHWQLATDPEDEESDCIWAGGAFLGYYPHEDVAKRVYKFCAGNGKWSDGPEIERPRGAGGAFSYKGKYYLVGGNVGGHGPHSSVEGWFDEYDPKSKKWTILEDVPHPRDHFFAAVLNDKLYVAGGRDGSVERFFAAIESRVDVYDFATGSWTSATDFPIQSGGSMVAVHGDRIMYGGGEGDQDAAFDDVYFFDGSSFSKAPKMPTPRHGTGYASCSGALWTAGGVSKQGGEPEVTTTEVYFRGSEIPVCKKDAGGSPDVTEDSLTAAATEEESSPKSEKACFPARALVELESGTMVAMEDLRQGDRIRVSGKEFSEVYFFSHSDSQVVTEFVSIMTEKDDASITLSPGHLLYVNGKLAPAREVSVGDQVKIVVSAKSYVAAVVEVSKTTARGLFNPHTVHGDVVVNGVITSCLTDALPSSVALSLLAPIKSAFAVTSGKPWARAMFLKLNSGILSMLDQSGLWRSGHGNSLLNMAFSHVNAKSEL